MLPDKKKIRKREVQLPDIYGKLPPQSINTEEVVLGAMLLEKDALYDVKEFLKEEMFYKESNKIIYKTISELFNEGSPVDIISVTDKLRNNGELDAVGGAYYISQLTDKVVSSSNIVYHARIIHQQFIKRAMIALSAEVERMAFDDTTDSFELLDMLSTGVSLLYENNVSGTAKPIKESVDEFQIAINEKRNMSKSEKIAIRTDDVLDDVLYGLNKGELYIVAGRPSMGKTAYALQLARNIAKRNIPVLFFSLEMTETEIINRIVGGESEINPKTISNADMTNDEWIKFNRESEKVKPFPLVIDDSPKMSIFEFKSKAHKYKRKYDIGVIIVDYIQLMDGDPIYNGNTNKSTGSISRTGKQIAKELSVPVVMLSQLNRATESTIGQIPKLSNLRESGEIEQDADVVMFPYRPYAAGIQEENGVSTFNDAKVIIAKHRSGALGVVNYHVSDDKTNWIDPMLIQSEWENTEWDAPDIDRNHEPKIKPNESF